MQRLFLFLFLWMSSATAWAQIESPCARLLVGLGRDSLSWTATPCAGFGGYVILGTTDLAAGFTALDTLTNPSPTLYAHNNPGETTWFYRIGMLCNGILTNQSPVISNERPVCPNLTDVSIVGGVPVVSWEASPSPEVIGYQLYKENPYGSGNYFPYPSAGFIINGLSYADVGATDLLARYALVAVSPCSKSLLGEGTALDGTTGPHTSMLVQGTLDGCTRQYRLVWNAYENWEFGVGGYEISLSRNGAPFIALDTVAALTYVYTNVQDGDNLQFVLRALESGTNKSALSNVLILDALVNRPMDRLDLTNVTTTPNDMVEIHWRWDLDVDFLNAHLQYSDDKTDWSNVLSYATLPTTATMLETDPAATPQSTRRYYRIVSTDACNTERRSNYGSNIVLRGRPEADYINRLSWDFADMEYGEVVDYQLYRINTNGSHSLVASLTPADTVVEHSVDIAVESNAQICYYLVANIEWNYPDGTSLWSESRSNTVCVQQSSIAYFPNAVAPDGKNRQFRPVLVFGKSISDYSLVVFDRYGGVVFETNDPYAAWDGTKNGDRLPQGIYVYTARFVQPDGKEVGYKGTVMVVR